MKNIFLYALIILCHLSVAQTTITSVSDGNWSNPSIWDVGVPNTGDDVIIEHFVTVDVTDTMQNVTIREFTTFTDTFYITGYLRLASSVISSPIVLVNDSINKGRLGVVNNGVTITGDIIWQKWIERCDGWGMYGNPFRMPLSDYGFFHTGFAGTPFPTFWVNTYYYDETIPDVSQDIGWVAPNNVNDTLPRGKGFFLFDSTITAIDESRVIELKGSIDLSENFDYNLQYSGANNNPDNGWNLVSNPWVGTIDWDRNGWGKRRIEDAIWVWDNCTNNYASYIAGIGVNGGQPTISSGQAFWVKANRSGARLRSRARVLTNQQEEIKRTGTHDGLIRISLNNDEIAFVLNDSATNQHDTLYDAVKFLCESSTLYTEADSNKYGINSIKDKDTTALYVKGDGTIEFDLSELSKVSTIYYLDRLSGVMYDAYTNPYYSFSSSISGFNHRFDLIVPKQISNLTPINPTGTPRLIHRYNSLGQLVDEHYIGLIIEVYDNGLTKKTIKHRF